MSYWNALSIPSQLVRRAVEYPLVCFSVALLWALWWMHGIWHCLLESSYSVLSTGTSLFRPHFYIPLSGLVFILASIIKSVYEILEENGRANALAYTFAFPNV